MNTGRILRPRRIESVSGISDTYLTGRARNEFRVNKVHEFASTVREVPRALAEIVFASVPIACGVAFRLGSELVEAARQAGATPQRRKQGE